MSVVGSGPRGVVLSNQSDNSPCAWLPLVKRLARDGLRVTVYYYSGEGAYKDTVAVAAKLRSLGGVKRLALIGASEGAKSSIAAAAKTHASAVVGLSPELSLDGYGNIVPAARVLRAPIVYAYSKGDPLSDLAVPQLYAATREKDKQMVAFSGYDHGVALLDHPTIPPLIERFLKRTLG